MKRWKGLYHMGEEDECGIIDDPIEQSLKDKSDKSKKSYIDAEANLKECSEVRQNTIKEYCDFLTERMRIEGMF